MTADSNSIAASEIIDYRMLASTAASLLSPTDVSERIKSLMQDPASSVEDIAEVVGCDPALTGQVLMMANRQRPSESPGIESVVDAIDAIGSENLRGMLFASASNDVFSQIPEELVSMQEFWHHSVCCGLAAEVLARRCAAARLERLFVAGLLHDIGQLPIYDRLPDHARCVLQRAGKAEQYRYRAEKEIIGYTHAQVGAELMRRWEFPQKLWEPVEFHHEPRRAIHFPLETAIVHIATNVANVIEPSWKTSGDVEKALRIIEPHAWQVTGLSEDDIDPVLSDVMMLAFDVTEIVTPNALTIY